ncbi:hypothetical protein ACFSKL_00380 [Belliella marina]|uniref:6-bladed beta-propeller protein n=1 Tax=Belliella marina TaxID=1644146 RepID=A0ABW4VHN6_9BACT
MRKTLLYLLFLSFIFSCNQKSDESESDQSGDLKNFTLEKLDSIQIEYLGNPIVHDIDPKSRMVLFMEFEEFSNDIMLTDFDGNIFNSFSKSGDVPDGFGGLLSPLMIDTDSSFLAFGYKGFNRYSFQGELFSNVPLEDFKIPLFQRIAMGIELPKINENFLVADKGSREIDYDNIQDHLGIKHFNLFNPKTGGSEALIQFPESSIYKSGKYFYRFAWRPVYTIEHEKIYVVFGGEPTIYIYDGKKPFKLISSIPIDLHNYQYFKGSDDKNLGHDFIGLFLSSGRIENIKKFGDNFLVSYFQGYEDVDREYFFANKTPDEAKKLRERLKEKYPFRLAIFDSLGNRLNDFVPEDLDPSSMIIRDEQLWMMEKPDPDIEKEYFRLYKVGLKGG